MKPLETGDPIRLGPYRLLGVLGEGGMGKVYVGQDAAGRVAAVKMLHPHLTADPALAQRYNDYIDGLVQRYRGQG